MLASIITKLIPSLILVTFWRKLKTISPNFEIFDNFLFSWFFYMFDNFEYFGNFDGDHNDDDCNDGDDHYDDKNMQLLLKIF